MLFRRSRCLHSLPNVRYADWFVPERGNAFDEQAVIGDEGDRAGVMVDDDAPESLAEKVDAVSSDRIY